MKTILFIAAATAGLSSLATAQANWSVTSPNGQVKVSVALTDLGNAGYPSGNHLYYRVEQGEEGHRSLVVKDSPLGLTTGEGVGNIVGQDFFAGLQFDSIKQQKTIEESYEVVHGKRHQSQNRAQQLTLTFHNANGQSMEFDIRSYDDGAAFRYRLPGQGKATVDREASGFAIPADAKVWAAPSDKPSTYAPAYETYYESGIKAGSAAPLGFGWSFPLLYRTADSHWALITEANVGPNYCGSRLSNNPTNAVYRIEFPNATEGQGHGDSKPSAGLPWEMPWRMIVVGDSLAAIVESTLVTDVSTPAKVKDTSWIKPGRVAWSWWSDPPSPQDGAKQKKFVDLAAEMGWEYVLVDANWDLMDNGNIHDVLRYAKEKNVGILLWYNSGGPHNVVTEKPRDTLYYPSVRKYELELLKKWGVKGIKVDFFQSDKQEIMALYHGMMESAAQAHIMINFHGCTLPRGWERTWPNLMSMEAVRGEECYIFDSKYPEKAPVQNTILPFTRNAVGPMDYTPVTFSNNNHPRRTTAAHELALSVVFETGWLHFADKAESYLNLPSAPKEFLKHVPVTWDDTRFVAGEPGEFVVLARRKGDTWYLAGINGRGDNRKQSISPGGWLKRGKYELLRIGDGEDAKTFSSSTSEFEAGNSFTVTMAPYGGFVATLKSK